MCPLVLLGLGMIEQVSEGMRPQKVAQRIWKPSRAVGIEFLLAMPIYAMMQNVVGRPAPAMLSAVSSRFRLSTGSLFLHALFSRH